MCLPNIIALNPFPGKVGETFHLNEPLLLTKPYFLLYLYRFLNFEPCGDVEEMAGGPFVVTFRGESEKMGLWQRITRIFRAGTGAALDKIENPELVLQQTI
ncbi:MAG TPA: hypothetical protein DEP46_04710, partial [Blastocatellia bacterium]|nr:hypothetical protein [Blastocatellia bacterium]